MPDHAVILVRNEPGTDGSAFLYQAAATQALEGRPIVMVCASRPPSAVRRHMRELGLQTEGTWIFVDAHSGLMSFEEEADFTLRDPHDLPGLVLELADLAADHPDAVVVFDSVSTLIDNTSLTAFQQITADLWAALARYQQAYVLFTDWSYPLDMRRLMRRCSRVVDLFALENRVVRNQAYAVTHRDGTRIAVPESGLFVVDRPGGVHLHVPKIVVTGIYDAGKTTFVHAVSRRALSTERGGTTVALDKGRYEGRGVTADVWGTPGQERFENMLPPLLEQAAAVIVLIDATRPESIRFATRMLDRVRRYGLHSLVAVTKLDLPDALPLDEISSRLGRHADLPMEPCKADDPESASRVMERLIENLVRVEVTT